MSAAGALGAGWWTEEAAGVRALERRLLGLWAARGCREVIPPLLLPDAAVRSASPEALSSRTLRLDANGEGPIAVRSDFTAGVALMASARLDALDEPVRLSYSGAVARRPSPERPGGLETRQAGYERISPSPGPEGDEEVVLTAAESLAALGLKDAVLELGHWGVVGPLLERLPWPEAGRSELERALNAKSLPAIDELAALHGKCDEVVLLSRLLHLGGRPRDFDSIAAELERAGLGGAWRHLSELAGIAQRAVPALRVRIDPADVRHWSYYTGLTLKAFSRRHPFALLAGGRYDALYPSLGRPFGACGFALYMERIMDVRTACGTDGGAPCRE